MSNRSDARWASIWTSLAVLVAGFTSYCSAQENAEMTIPESLQACYGNTSLMYRDKLPVMGMSQLIEIIRKVEAWPYTSLDITNMALQMTHRFRMDGIKRDSRIIATSGVIPYTPAGPEFYRHRILLTDLIPGNAYTFPNKSLSSAEKCALHFMLSSTMDDIYRGNEDSVCSYLTNYETEVSGTSSRYYGGGYGQGTVYNRGRVPTRKPRKARDASPGISSDVEIIDPTTHETADPLGSEQRASFTNYQHSRCPIQSGVVWTRWGGVTGGSVLAGVAAGMNPQSIPVASLNSARSRSKSFRTRNPTTRLSADVTGSVDNKWASTVSGELAIVAVMQGPAELSSMPVGMAGGWNSTLEPRYYFMSSDLDGAMTDANVRGSVDGLILASNVYSWNSQVNNGLKLSQLLDMYYSERGVFTRNTRACLRRERYSDLVTTDTLTAQTESFSRVFYEENTLSVTMDSSILTGYADSTASLLQSYIPSSLSDPTCELGTTDLLVRPYVDVIILLDTSWQYDTIRPALGYLFDRLEAGQFGSNVTVINAKDGTTLFNSSYPLLDWHTNYTQTLHEASAQGFDLLTSLGAATKALRGSDTYGYSNRVLAGRGKVVLFVPLNSLGDYTQQQFFARRSNFKRIYPDVDFVVMAQGSKTSFSVLTNQTDKDVFILSTSDPGTSIRAVAGRLTQISRRVRNPNCDADWIEGRTGNTEFTDYVEPLGVNYYKISPNNFFKSSSARLRLQNAAGALTVCYSRSISRPNSTTTMSGVTCTQLSTSSNIAIDLSKPCDGVSFIVDCQPLYVSVSAPQTTTTSTSTSSVTVSVRCTDDACRFPDQIRYTLIAESFGCWSGASSVCLSSVVGALVALIVSLRLLQ